MKLRFHTRPQLSLATLLAAVIACSVFSVILTDLHTTYHVSIHCQKAPADDHRLAAWFREQEGVENVVTWRDRERINVEFAKYYGKLDVIDPPLADLGYTGLQNMISTSSTPSLISSAAGRVTQVPPYIWLGVTALYAAWLNRRALRRRRLSAVTSKI